MSEMVEKIMREMIRSDHPDRTEAELNRLFDAYGDTYLMYAVSALTALEQPTEAMVEAGGKFLSEQWEGDNWTDPQKRTRWCFEAQDAFSAMIAAAKGGEDE